MSSNVDTSGAAGAADEGENALIRDLRAQLKETKAALKAVDPDAIRQQVLAEANRESTAASLMDKAGYPKLSSLYATQVDGELSEASAAEFLAGLGLAAGTPTDDPKPPQNAGGFTPAQIATEVERLASAGSEMGTLGQTDVPLEKLIAEARTADDITKIMRESGLTVRGH